MKTRKTRKTKRTRPWKTGSRPAPSRRRRRLRIPPTRTRHRMRQPGRLRAGKYACRSPLLLRSGDPPIARRPVVSTIQRLAEPPRYEGAHRRRCRADPRRAARLDRCARTDEAVDARAGRGCRRSSGAAYGRGFAASNMIWRACPYRRDMRNAARCAGRAAARDKLSVRFAVLAAATRRQGFPERAPRRRRRRAASGGSPAIQREPSSASSQSRNATSTGCWPTRGG